MIEDQPTITTETLILRPYRTGDEAAIVFHANDFEVTQYTEGMPFPYTLDDATSWVQKTVNRWLSGEANHLANTLKATGNYIGGAGLTFRADQKFAALGYWLGKKYWGKHLATEAATGLVDWGFEHKKLHKIVASYTSANIASGAVLYALGMKTEGFLREHFLKNGEYLNVRIMGILRSEWELCRSLNFNQPHK